MNYARNSLLGKRLPLFLHEMLLYHLRLFVRLHTAIHPSTPWYSSSRFSKSLVPPLAWPLCPPRSVADFSPLLARLS